MSSDTNTLEGLGRAVLETLEGRRADAATLESEFDASREELDEQLSQLVENALVREADGERLLDSTPTGEHDDRIDTSDRVERAIEGFDLRPDEAAAVRGAFAFVRYWGEATATEIVDAVYSEQPAGYGSAEGWWADCVEAHLAALPDVEVPTSGAEGSNASTEGRWRYAGDAGVEEPDRDGREVRDRGGEAPFGSVRHALEELDLTDAERTAARAAFSALSAQGSATTTELADALFDEQPAGYDAAEAWADWLDDLLEELPNVEREDGRWIHDPAPE